MQKVGGAYELPGTVPAGGGRGTPVPVSGSLLQRERGEIMRYTRAERAANLLNKLGYTHQDLADATGYSRSHITRALNGARYRQCLSAIEAQLRHWQVAARNKKRTGS